MKFRICLNKDILNKKANISVDFRAWTPHPTLFYLHRTKRLRFSLIINLGFWIFPFQHIPHSTISTIIANINHFPDISNMVTIIYLSHLFISII